MPQHASHAKTTRKYVAIGGALVTAAIATTVIVLAWHNAFASASMARNALVPAISATLQAGIDATVRSCEIERPKAPSSPEAPRTTRASYAPALADIAALPEQAEPFAFCLDPDSVDAAPTLSAESETCLQEARDAFLGRGWDAGYLLIDLETGCGLAANLDAVAYGASTFKAPYALYLCETQLDTQQAALDTPCLEDPATTFMDPAGTYLHDGIASYPLGTLIADSVTLSDNDSYRILRAAFDAEGFPSWLAEKGLPSSLTGDWFPTYSTRTAGMLWLLMANYLDSDATSAPLLSGLLEQSETSFLRDALNADQAIVRGKAGWHADDDPAFCGVCDAGIVETDEGTYLLCAMSTAPFSQESEGMLESLLATVFNARSDIA